MDYSACKYVLDFYIVLFLSMLSQAVVFNKIFNLLYKRLIFIHVNITRVINERRRSPVLSMPSVFTWLRLRAG